MKIFVKKNFSLFRFSRCDCTEIRRLARIEADERRAAGEKRKKDWPDFEDFTPWRKRKMRAPSAGVVRRKSAKSLEIEKNGKSREPLLNAITNRIKKLRVRNEDPESSGDEEFSILEKRLVIIQLFKNIML